MTLDELKQTMFANLGYRLGAGIIDLELDPEHYEAAYQYAIKVYRQRAQNATEETYTLFSTEKNMDIYIKTDFENGFFMEISEESAVF